MIKQFGLILKDTFKAWHEDNVMLLAGAISFFAVFALVPILILTIALLGLILGEHLAQDQVIKQTAHLSNPQTATAVKSLLLVARKSGAGLASFISGLVLFFVSMHVFSHLQDALAIIWRVDKKKTSVIKRVLKKRLISFFMLLGVGVFLLLSFLSDISLQLFSSSVNTWMPDLNKPLFWRLLSSLVSFGIVAILCALAYRYGPSSQVKWNDVWLGSLIASFLLLASGYVLTFYFRWSNILTLYGAAGSILVVLLWVYVSAQIFLFGAEMTWVVSTRKES